MQRITTPAVTGGKLAVTYNPATGQTGTVAVPAAPPAEAKLWFAGGAAGQSAVPVRTSGACSIAWGRSQSALAVPDSAPGAIASR